MLDNVVSSLLLILGALGVLSLVLSGFLVFNTIAAVLARQGPQIGVMKAVGASRRDVLTMYLATVGVYSVLALVIAVPSGALAAWVLTRQLGTLLNIDINSFGAPAWVWWTEVCVGLVVPIVAALGPILSGTRATVAEAIRGGDSSDGFGTGRIDRALARLQGLPESLRYAARNTFRRKLRLALTVVALSMGGAILVTVLTLRGSLLATVDSIEAYWQQDVTVDLQEASSFADLENVVESTDGFERVEGWLIAPSSAIRADGQEAVQETIVFGVPPSSAFIEPTLVRGRWLEPGDDRVVVLNVDVAANESDVSVGDDLTLRILGVDVVWQVIGISTTQLVAPGEPRPSAPIAYVPYGGLDSAMGSTGAVNRLVVSGSSHDTVAQEALADSLDADLRDAGVGVRAIETRARMRAQVERLTTPILLLLASMAGVVRARRRSGFARDDEFERVGANQRVRARSRRRGDRAHRALDRVDRGSFRRRAQLAARLGYRRSPRLGDGTCCRDELHQGPPGLPICTSRRADLAGHGGDRGSCGKLGAGPQRLTVERSRCDRLRVVWTARATNGQRSEADVYRL